MSLQDRITKENNVFGEEYSIKKLDSRKDAKRIIDFFLSENSFDDRNFTEGEIIQLKSLPYESLYNSDFIFWYAENNADGIIGVMSLRNNEQKSGGYFIDYITVHRKYRNRGIAIKLMDGLITYVKGKNGRYIHANTCDTSLYEGIRNLFAKRGFDPVGHLPDYYFEGEGMIIYYKKVN